MSSFQEARERAEVDAARQRTSGLLECPNSLGILFAPTPASSIGAGHLMRCIAWRMDSASVV